MEHSIIANSGIQLFTFPLEIDLRKNFKRWFHEWYDKEEGVHKLDLVECVNTEEGDTFYYNKKDLINKGYLTAFETRQIVILRKFVRMAWYILWHPTREKMTMFLTKSSLCHLKIVSVNCHFMRINGFRFRTSVDVCLPCNLTLGHSIGRVPSLF